MNGRVLLIGAGPGDPGLITVRGVEALGACDVVVYDHLVAAEILKHVKSGADLIYAGKQGGEHTLSQNDINELLVSRAQAGATVGRLKGGDPFVFGRGGEEALALVDAGIDFEVIPGVTAGVAGAAYAGIPVTHRELASAAALITGHETPDKDESDLDMDVLAKWPGTLAFYMGVKNLRRLCEGLLSHGMGGRTPAAVVRWATTPAQEAIVGTVADLPDLADRANVAPPAMIFIGPVVTLREKLAWFERRPLFGRRVVVTRARAQASSLSRWLRDRGADVMETPTIRIAPPEDPAPLREAIGRLETFDWVVFTSVNGVEGFFDELKRVGLDSRALQGCRICSVGPATSAGLGRNGITPDAQPAKFVTSEIAATMAAQGNLAGAHILCPRTDIAPPGLTADLAACGAEVCEVVAYRTIPDHGGIERLGELLDAGNVDWITFTSSSTVRNLLAGVPADRIIAGGARLASIGPVTSATMRERGLTPTIEADPHTVLALAEAILSIES